MNASSLYLKTQGSIVQRLCIDLIIPDQLIFLKFKPICVLIAAQLSISYPQHLGYFSSILLGDKKQRIRLGDALLRESAGHLRR